MISLAAFWIAHATGQTSVPKKPLVLSYSIISNGAVAGQEVDTFGNGTLEAAFEYNDRGRGPNITGHYDFDNSGLPTKTLLQGVDYYKAPVDEHFWTTKTKANWKSTTENGHDTLGGFYFSNNGASAEYGMLAAAILRAKHPVRLYPGGEASIEKVDETTLTQGNAKEHVTEYALSGLGFAPLMIWLDDDNWFFAFPDTWQATIRKGWESSNLPLYRMQAASEDKWYTQVATSISNHPEFPVAFRHVRIFDSETATTKEDQDVIVRGNKIDKVGDAGSIEVPADSEQIDGSGQTLLPGLFDMHTHLTNSDGLLDIACGVTSCRDMGNNMETLDRLQRTWEAGDQVGPRVFKAGLIDGTGPYQCPTGLYADTLEQALADVNKYVDDGFIQIKIYSSLNPTFVPEIAKLAHSRGVRVSGHVPQGIFASDFVNDGADEIQHMNFIMLNFLRDKVKDSRTPERFTAVGQYGASIDQNSQEVKDFIDLLLSHHTTVDATVATFEGMFCSRPGVVTPQFASVVDRMPVQIQRSALSGGLPTTPANDKTYMDSFAAMLQFLGKLYNAGIPILAGTDDLVGFTLHRELELEVKAGIPAPKALQIATLNAAKLLKQDNLGAIAPGKTADLYLVEGNPAVNISDIRRSRVVMKNGVLFHCDQVYAASGIKPAK